MTRSLFVNVCTECVCMLLSVFVCLCAVLYCTVRAMPPYIDLQNRLSQAKSIQATVGHTWCCAFPSTHTQIVCKPSVPPCRVSAGKSCGPAPMVHQVSHPAKSEVAEFACKFKCLLAHAALNWICMRCCGKTDANNPPLCRHFPYDRC